MLGPHVLAPQHRIRAARTNPMCEGREHGRILLNRCLVAPRSRSHEQLELVLVAGIDETLSDANRCHDSCKG